MHLTDDQLNEYLDHETNEPAEIEAHLSGCAACRARLRALQALFDEIESLPELALSLEFSAIPPSVPPKLPRSLRLTVTLQAALAVVAIIVAAPLVMQSLSPYASFASGFSALSLFDIFLQIQRQWTAWLDMLSTLSLPIFPEIPVVNVSNLFMMFTVLGVSLLWLIGNGLLLRNQMK